MIRIVDGIPFLVKQVDAYKLKAHDLGNGHLEVTASRMTVSEELDWPPQVMQDYLDCVERNREENEAERRERSIKSAARRARNRVRRLCKAMGADTMLTLTYRANMTDLAACKAHLKEFNRRLLRHLPDFAMIAAFEPQERGAWHVHIATTRIPRVITVKGKAVAMDRNKANGFLVKSYDAIRAVWRSVTGELGGTVNVSRRKFTSAKSAAEIASYIAGYIVKEFGEGVKWSNRWTHFGGQQVPEPIELGVCYSAQSMLTEAFGLLDNRHVVVSMYLNKWHDGFFLSAELPPDKRSIST